MKTKVILFLVILFGLVFIGCGNENSNSNSGNENQTSQFDIDFEVISNDIKKSIPRFVTEDVVLIEEYPEYNAIIEWSSSNENVINFIGNVTIDRSKAIEVTLTYNVIIGENSKEETINIIVSPSTPEQVANKFFRQFDSLITRDYDVVTNYLGIFEISWSSSNTEVFTNDGAYIRPDNDTEFEIQCSVIYKDYESEVFKHKYMAQGLDDDTKLVLIEKWLKTEVLSDLYIKNDVTLPSEYKKYNVKITWESSNPDVITPDGKVNHYVFERYVTLICNYKLDNGSGGSIKSEVIVSSLDISTMTKEEILNNFLNAIALQTYSGISFGYDTCPVLSKTYGSLYFYTNTVSEIKEMIIKPGSSNRFNTKMDPQLVVIHDTANYNAGAYANANYCYNGGGGTSWHYTTGNDGIYQTLPENEPGAHANGSRSTPFELVDTGIKATVLKPQIFIGDDKYIYVNNIKTNFIIPNLEKKFADDGVICEIGENGNYWISKIWYCDGHKYNANVGGNASGIGIESAVNSGADYIKTVRLTTKLVAEILIRHNLGINRVVQHNTMSGKNCPQAIREANYWYTFKDFVSLEKFAKEYLSEYHFSWKSNSAILDNQGYISKNINGIDSIEYSVLVTKNGNKVMEKNFITKII